MRSSERWRPAKGRRLQTVVSTEHYDVIVVGAGPAGNVAAYELARAGRRVVLLEKQHLPRHKTCGGGMPMIVSQVLALEELRDLAPDAFVESETYYMRHTYEFADPLLAPMNPPNPNPDNSGRPLSLWMVRRSVFDNVLAQRAARAGAELRDGYAVRHIDLTAPGAILVNADANGSPWVATCDIVIGADGANGVVARETGLRTRRSLAIAIEAEVPHRWGEGHSELRPDVCHLEYGAVRRGYAWVFPKADHLNVGAGVFRPRNADGRGDNRVRAELRQAIVDYLSLLEVPQKEENLVFHAHPLPIWNGLDRLQSRDDRVLLAGDAAGLINPFFGDGILHALKSGQIAAQAVVRNERAGYTAAIGAEFAANFDAALNLAKVFYQWPAFCYRHGVKRDGATRTATRLLCGEAMFHDVSGRVMRRMREAMRTDREVGRTESSLPHLEDEPLD